MTEEKNNNHKKYTNGRVFIIRPFKLKTNRNKEEIDFDKVDNQLITPCVEKLGLSGGTTGEFVQQGNIRKDMFRELLAADLVIADISIHNANVFYELGIRHALRDRCTVLIKANKNTDPGIFDLSADRYMSYDLDNPSQSIEELINTIIKTLDNDATDSPVFDLLPGLTNMDPDKVVIVPLDFVEKVDQYLYDKKRTELVNIKKNDVIGEPWETQGLRLIGNAQYELADYDEAIKTWEAIRKYNKFDTQANQRLATCYQKIGENKKSEQATERALQQERGWDRAETHALNGSNLKKQWRGIWEPIKTLKKRQSEALQSSLLEESYNAYRTGFEQHRSHFYSGLNATAMLSIQLNLAKLRPKVWALGFDNKERADFEYKERNIFLTKMIGATELAIETSIKNYDDGWAKVSKADLMLLTCNDPKKVANEYKKWLNIIDGFTAKSLKNQLKLYKKLGLFSTNIASIYKLI